MTLEDNRLEDRAYELSFAARIARFSQILSLTEEYRGIERVKDRAQAFTDKARQIIGEFPESPYQRALMTVTELLTDRDH
jgi:octaprenyl-diphosphate synthase